ncbi:phage gp6-like head-tail connector protein [Agrobacterium rhizogenes]|uniref:head-tail connector protein n=1 Tax=Rhizobium rhizogenes TaxID=359 RepID=UPI001573F5F5|nr:head-tail connector protein [Rhizobium rhizogenes]NTG48975.1 phage gp6-like head-tail connector protein [Rhizobium rhizogenes]
MGDVVVTAVGPLYALEEVKQHLNVDFDDDDTLIQSYMDAAESAVLQYCNLSLVPQGKEAIFKTAAMIAVDDLYENRGGKDGLPAASRLLIDPYRWLRV